MPSILISMVLPLFIDKTPGPLPPAIWLFGSALALLGWRKRPTA